MGHCSTGFTRDKLIRLFMIMVDKNLRLAILHQARESLKQRNLSDGEKDELLKLLDILILALEKYVPPENLAGESHIGR